MCCAEMRTVRRLYGAFDVQNRFRWNGKNDVPSLGEHEPHNELEERGSLPVFEADEDIGSVAEKVCVVVYGV